MEKRIAKVNISAAGGTAANGARTCKVTLPNAWIDKLGVTAEHREVEFLFDGKQIVISACKNGNKFASRKLSLGHDVRLIQFYDNDILCTTIYADFTDETLIAENYIDNPIKTAFGNKTKLTWDDLLFFLEDRCIPRGRAGLREYLEAIGVFEYDPLGIIKKTAGRMAEDNQWLQVEVL